VSNVFIALDEPPEWMTRVGDAFPLKAFAVAFTDAMNSRDGWSGFASDRFVVLGAWTLVGVLIALRAFRWEPQSPQSQPRRQRSSRRSGV